MYNQDVIILLIVILMLQEWVMVMAMQCVHPGWVLLVVAD